MLSKKKKKKKVFTKIFQAISTKKRFPKMFQALHKILTIQKIVLSSSQGQANFRGLEASRPRPRTSKSVLEYSTSGSYSHGFKNVRKVIDMALKLLFFAAKSKKSLSGWRLSPQTPLGIRLSSIGLFTTGTKLHNFCAKKFYYWFKLPLLQ